MGFDEAGTIIHLPLEGTVFGALALVPTGAAALKVEVEGRSHSADVLDGALLCEPSLSSMFSFWQKSVFPHAGFDLSAG